MKKILSTLLILSLFTIALFAQDDVVTETPNWINQVLDWFMNNIAIILPIIYELIARLFPTSKDYGIFRIIQSVVDFLIANRKADGGRFVAYSKKEDRPVIGAPTEMLVERIVKTIDDQTDKVEAE